MSNGNKIISLKESYYICMEIAGNKAGPLKRSFLSYALSFIALGCAYSCFFPMMVYSFGEKADMNKALFWLGIMLVFTVLDLVFRWKGNEHDYKGDVVEISNLLRKELGEKLKNMPLEKLYKYRTGHLNSILGGNVDESVLLMGVVASLLIQTVIVPVIVCAAAFAADWRVGLILMLILPLGVPIYRWRRRAAMVEKHDVAEAHSVVESDILEYTQGLHVLRAMNLTGEKSDKLQSSVKKLRKIQTAGLVSSTAPSLLMSVVIELGLVVAFAAGTLFIVQGSMTVPVLAALLVAVSRLIEPMSIFVHVATVIDIMSEGFSRIKKLLAEPEQTAAQPEEEPVGYGIEFSDVSFAYMGDTEDTMKDVSFVLPPRSLTAIVGPSGSGKTTITRLIMRYADVRKGSVKIGGADIRHMTGERLMSYISAVFQDVYLFDDTILNNIRTGRPDASDDEVIAAAKAAHCHEFIDRLPLGYETRTGDIGGSLSGGEKQRISIARAILKDSPIVILDEPTAALDTESEAAVQKAVDSLVQDKTVIVIAHRLSTVKNADKILVIEDGRLSEEGSHRELLEKKGRYSAMWAAQHRIKDWKIRNT